LTLSIGNRLGPYEIVATLGAGGMGEVYRGRDTELNRDVALKVLGERFAEDPDRLARFKREAQVLASLNHPHIGAIYGVADFPGGRALVLELVEGPTLADRIAAGPIPLEEALPIARQIAEALAAAQELGIVHRDLKPANIKLRQDGAVKVLDFGLAKAAEPGTASADATQSPTITSPAMTQMGMILGTAAYMSPEQAKGRPADKRSDVWAFGCVLFEMLTGQRAFAGEDVAETLALVLTKEPGWNLLPHETPPAIRRLLRRCLARDRSRRLADIADARLEIDEREKEATAAVPARPFANLVRWLPWVMAAAAVAAAVWFANRTAVDRSAADSRVVRSSILLPGRVGSPAATGFAFATGATLALSPDGRRLALVLTDSTGRRQLWMRALDAAEARPLAGTEDAISPFWSPDGRWLAFVANGKLKKLDPSGGLPATLCDSAVVGGAWSRNGVILFTHGRSQALAQVPAAGGTPSMVTEVDSRSEWRHAFPCFLPDGRHFVFAVGGFGDEIYSDISSLGSRERTRLPMNSAFLQYARGCLMFVRGSTLMAQPFDERRHVLLGTAAPITERLRLPNAPSGASFASVSAAGTLVFQEDPTPGFELTWHDREGHRTSTLAGAADYADLTLSPDGRQALVSVADPGATNRDLWIFDLTRGVRTRFTFDPAPETHCIWSPDGSRIVFDSQRKGHRDLYQKAADGTGAEELLLADEFDKNPMGWSPDGRFILYARRRGADVKIWVLPLGGDRRPFPFRETTASFQLGGAFSPDGAWVAYFSNESGRTEIYVSPFSNPGRATQISTEGGLDARWGRDGKEIFYRTSGLLMAAAVSVGRQHFEVGEVKPLFALQRVGRRWTYDVSADGRRFLAVTARPQAGSEPLTLVQNWPALLKK
jgi:eukaryotic-like serine/threonine-protein kinase